MQVLTNSLSFYNCLDLNILQSVLGFLLEPQLVGVPALSLSAVGCLHGKGGIALSAYLLLDVVFLGNCSHCWIHTSSSQSEDKVEG